MHLGNICRLPIAEAVVRKLVTDQNVSDNGGQTVQQHPHMKQETLLIMEGRIAKKKRGVPINHIAQQVMKEDLATFDYILGMDESNLRDLTRESNQVKNSKAKIKLPGSYDPQKQFIIEDPYKGRSPAFRHCTGSV